MKKSIWIIPLIALLAGCSSSTTKKDKVVGGELLLDISAKDMKKQLTRAEWPIDGLTVYGYRAYKIHYTTKDDKNISVGVSGLLVVPTGLNAEIKEDGLALVSYGHGTIALNRHAPTVLTKKYDYPIVAAVVFSSLGGFVTLAADYIGYGDSVEHYHPYVTEGSLSKSSVDFIAAAKKFAEKNHIKINDKLFVTGYSEGGYTAMSTLKRLEESHIQVTAAAPMAGAYDLLYMADAALGLNNESLEGYIMTYNALTINAYTKIYDKNISTIVKEPYASKIEGLLDGYHSFDQINNALPDTAKDLFQDSFIQEYRSGNNSWFKKALKDNSVGDWAPRTPIRLIHCKGDDQVPYTISQNTYDRMATNGAKDVTLITPDDQQSNSNKWDHIKCYFPALKNAALWFAEKRDE